MFVDRVQLRLLAGKGGDGVAAFRREKFLPKGGPFGGDGGDGGSITFRASPHPFSLEAFRNLRTIAAKNGQHGGANHRTGKRGENLSFDVPLGTLIKDMATGETLFDFTEKEQFFIACKGGKGGKGNAHFKSPTNRTPREFTLGTKGETKEVILELKMIADIGLVGLPNAGKSTLITSLTPTSAKVGAYPFTTLKPNLGLLTFESGVKKFIADIPGIIRGAHQNKGLGHAFLRHVERTRVLIFVLDLFSPTLLDDFTTLQEELMAYNPELLKKPSLLFLNKIDLPGADQLVTPFLEKHPNLSPILVSAKEKIGLQEAITSLETLFSSQDIVCEENKEASILPG
ncbi:MAG: GTPase ObgE [Chlamydiota bacterium]